MGAGTQKQGGSSKIGRGFLTLIDRHMTLKHNFFSPNQLQHKLRPTTDSKDYIGCQSVLILNSYTILQTPHLTLTLTSEIGAETKAAVSEIMRYEIAGPFCNSLTGPHRTMAPF